MLLSSEITQNTPKTLHWIAICSKWRGQQVKTFSPIKIYYYPDLSNPTNGNQIWNDDCVHHHHRCLLNTLQHQHGWVFKAEVWSGFEVEFCSGFVVWFKSYWIQASQSSTLPFIIFLQVLTKWSFLSTWSLVNLFRNILD